MQQAIKSAKKASKKDEVPVGAVLIKNDKLMATAHNQPIRTSDPTAHAEILVLRKGAKKQQNYRLLNTTLYVTLEPCVMCVGAMIHARIERIVFGAYDLKTGVAESVANLFETDFSNHNPEVIGGVLADECGQLLTDFFKNRR